MNKSFLHKTTTTFFNSCVLMLSKFVYISRKHNSKTGLSYIFQVQLVVFKIIYMNIWFLWSNNWYPTNDFEVAHFTHDRTVHDWLQLKVKSLHCFSNPNSRTKKVLTAQAEAEKIRFIGEAEAASIEAVGKAEAEKMRLKAEAYQQYGDAAKTALVLEALPKVGSTFTPTGFRRNPQHLGSLLYWSDCGDHEASA